MATSGNPYDLPMSKSHQKSVPSDVQDDQTRARMPRGELRSRLLGAAGLMPLAVIAAGALMSMQPAHAAGSPPCVVQGPQWTQHIPSLGAGHPASILKGRFYVVMPPQYGCAKAKRVLARIFPLIPPHAKAHDLLRGGPPGWVCRSSGSSRPTDVTFAGLCQNDAHAFFEWGPYSPPTR